MYRFATLYLLIHNLSSRLLHVPLTSAYIFSFFSHQRTQSSRSLSPLPKKERFVNFLMPHAPSHYLSVPRMHTLSLTLKSHSFFHTQVELFLSHSNHTLYLTLKSHSFFHTQVTLFLSHSSQTLSFTL